MCCSSSTPRGPRSSSSSSMRRSPCRWPTRVRVHGEGPGALLRRRPRAARARGPAALGLPRRLEPGRDHAGGRVPAASDVTAGAQRRERPQPLRPVLLQRLRPRRLGVLRAGPRAVPGPRHRGRRLLGDRRRHPAQRAGVAPARRRPAADIGGAHRGHHRRAAPRAAGRRGRPRVGRGCVAHVHGARAGVRGAALLLVDRRPHDDGHHPAHPERDVAGLDPRRRHRAGDRRGRVVGYARPLVGHPSRRRPRGGRAGPDVRLLLAVGAAELRRRVLPVRRERVPRRHALARERLAAAAPGGGTVDVGRGDYALTMRPGTRHASAATIELTFAGGVRTKIRAHAALQLLHAGHRVHAPHLGPRHVRGRRRPQLRLAGDGRGRRSLAAQPARADRVPGRVATTAPSAAASSSSSSWAPRPPSASASCSTWPPKRASHSGGCAR